MFWESFKQIGHRLISPSTCQGGAGKSPGSFPGQGTQPGRSGVPCSISAERNVLAAAMPQQAAFSFRPAGGEIVATGREAPPSRVESTRQAHINTPLTFLGWDRTGVSPGCLQQVRDSSEACPYPGCGAVPPPIRQLSARKSCAQERVPREGSATRKPRSATGASN